MFELIIKNKLMKALKIYCLAVLILSAILPSKAQESTFVTKGPQYLVMKNNKGEVLFQLKYVNRYTHMTPLMDGYALAYAFKKADVLNSKGEVINTIKDLKCFDATNLGSGVFAIKDNGYKWAYFNHEGKQLTDFVHDGPSVVKNGYIRLYDKKTKKVGMIDITGKQVIPFEYESLSEGFDPNGHVVVGKKEGSLVMKYALMDKNLKLKTDFEFVFLHNMTNAQYLYSRAPSLVGLPYAFNQLGTKGLMDRDLTILTPEIIPAEAFVGLDTAGKRRIKFEGKNFTFLSTGKFSPDNGEFEYFVANSRLPKEKDTWRNQDSLGWDISKQLYRIALQKGYQDASRKLDSLQRDQFYINAHPVLKYKQDALKMDQAEKLAKTGQSESMLQLADAYLRGAGRPVDTLAAINWLSQAEKKANLKAPFLLANLYISMQKPNDAINRLKPYINRDTISKALYDTLHQAGGKEYMIAQAMRKNRNFSGAEVYFLKAKELKHKEAGFQYGLMLIKEVDKNLGIAALQESAKEGDVSSMLYLGLYSAPWAYEANRNSNWFNTYLSQVSNSPNATEAQKQRAKGALESARRMNERPNINAGTVVSLRGVKKVVTLVQADGFYVSGGQYVHAPGLKPTAYAPFTILSESNENYRKTCGSCGGSGKHNKQVVSGTYTTTDVTYRTGSTISGDKKVTTVTTHNNYRTIDEQCIVCSGKGYVF